MAMRSRLRRRPQKMKTFEATYEELWLFQTTFQTTLPESDPLWPGQFGSLSGLDTTSQHWVEFQVCVCSFSEPLGVATSLAIAPSHFFFRSATLSLHELNSSRPTWA